MKIKTLTAAVFSVTLAACGTEGIESSTFNNTGQSFNPSTEQGNINSPQATPATPSQPAANHEQVTRLFENHPQIQSFIAAGDQFDFRSQQVTQVRDILTGKGVTVTSSNGDFSGPDTFAVTSENTTYAFCNGGRLGLASNTDQTFVNNGFTSDSPGFFNNFNSADDSAVGYWDIGILTTTLDSGERFTGIVIVPMIDVSQLPEVQGQNLPYPSQGQQNVVTGGLVLTGQGEALAIIPALITTITSLNNQGIALSAADQELFPFADPSAICAQI